MNPNQLLATVSYAGRLLLESGAETYRVEETMVRLCHCFDIDEAESFVTPTGVMMTITVNQQAYTKIMRVQNRGVDLNRIDKINSLSRTAVSKHYTVSQLDECLKEIENEKKYKKLTILLFGALGAFGFSFLFHGGIYEAVAAFIIGFCIKAVYMLLEKRDINSFFENVISSSLAAFMALGTKLLLPFVDVNNIIISSIMLLVPGLAITNAIRDTVAGDFLAGISRGAEAFLIAIAIAVGCGFALSVWVKLGGIL